MAFIIFNGTVVYEQGPIRWAGLGLFLGLGLVLVTRTAVRRRALATVLSSLVLGVPTAAAQEPGLRIAPDFRITLYADENLANDIFAAALCNDQHAFLRFAEHGFIRRHARLAPWYFGQVDFDTAAAAACRFTC